MWAELELISTWLNGFLKAPCAPLSCSSCPLHVMQHLVLSDKEGRVFFQFHHISKPVSFGLGMNLCFLWNNLNSLLPPLFGSHPQPTCTSSPMWDWQFNWQFFSFCRRWTWWVDQGTGLDYPGRRKSIYLQPRCSYQIQKHCRDNWLWV